MKAIRDNVIFTLEKETEDEYKTSGGLTIYIDTQFDPARHARQYGKVVSVSKDIERYKEHKDGVQLFEGDKVWLHHHAIDKKSINFEQDGKVYYCMPYSLFFAVERGNDFIPLGEFLFVRPHVEKESFGAFQNPLRGNLSKRTGEVVYVNESTKATTGIKEGDIAYLSGTGVYEMEIFGETLYRMRIRQIVGVAPLKEIENKLERPTE